MVYITRNNPRSEHSIQMSCDEFDSFVIGNNSLLFSDESGNIFTLYNGFCIAKVE